MSSSSRERDPPPSPLPSTDVAFAGLRLLRREPRTWAIWSGLSLVVSLGLGALSVVLTGPAMMRLQATNAQGGGKADSAAAMAALGAVLPGNLAIIAVSLLFYGVMNAAVLRAVLRPGPDGKGHLRLGGDELRQMAVLVLLWLVLAALFMAVSLVAVILTAVVAGAAAGMGMAAGGAASSAGTIALVVLMEIVVFVIAGAAFAFVGVRLSLAAPLTFDSGRIRLFGSWKLTRRRFWPLFGAYVLALAILLVAGLAVVTVFGAVAMGLGGGVGGASFILRPDMTSVATYFTPLQVLYLVVCAPLGAAWIATQAGAPADAYARITGAESPLSVFGPSASDRSTAFGTRV